MVNSFIGTNPQPSDFVSQLAQMQQSGAALGTSIANNAASGMQAASGVQLQQAQIPLVQAQTAGAQQNNAMGYLRMQMMQTQMAYAQHLISSMNQGPVNDDGSSSAVGSQQAQDTADASGDDTAADNAAPAPAGIGVSATATPSGTPATLPAAPAASNAGASIATAAQPAAPNTSAPLTLADVQLDAGHIDNTVQKRFGVFGTMTPQEFQSLQQARAMDTMAAANGMPTNYAAMVQANYQQRIKQATATAAKNSSSTYDLLTDSIVNAPKGTAFQAMQRLNIGGDGGGAVMAKRLQAVATAQDWTPAQLDQVTRTVASETANAMFRYTGRDTVTGTDNVTRDKATMQPITGAQQVGINPNTVVQAAGRSANAGAQMVNVPDGQGGTRQVPLWQANGYPSLEAFKAAAGIPQTPGMPAGAQPSATGATMPTAGATMPGTTTPTAAPPGSIPGIVAQKNSRLTPAQVQQLQPVAAKYGTDPQTLHTSLTDSGYRLQLPTAPQGQTLSPDQDQIRKDYAEHVKSEQDDASEEIDGASQSLQYLKAAQQIMSNGGADVTGLYGPVKAMLSRVFPGGVNATNYQEAVKYLGNAALQGAKQTYGSRMTQTEVQLQKNELSPSASMQPAAVNNLLGEMSRVAQYTIDRGQRLRPYLAAGNDARYFDQWNQQYYPRQSIVNNITPSTQQPATTGSPSAAPGLPDPTAARGRIIVNPATGQRRYSNGSTWVTVPQGWTPQSASGATGAF